MGMFVVDKGTKVVVLKADRAWDFHNMTSYTTKKDNVFEKHDMVVDPTGINKFAKGPSDKTIRGLYARDGWYVFKRDNWYLFVASSKVRYI